MKGHVLAGGVRVLGRDLHTSALKRAGLRLSNLTLSCPNTSEIPWPWAHASMMAAGPSSYRKSKKRKQQSWIFHNPPGTCLSPGWTPPKPVGVHLVGFTCAVTEGSFPHLDYKGSWSPQSNRALPNQTPPYHYSFASPVASPSLNFLDDCLENKEKHGWGGCHFFSNVYFSYFQFFGEIQERKGHATASQCLVLLSWGPLPLPKWWLFPRGQTEPRKWPIDATFSAAKSYSKSCRTCFPAFFLLWLNLAFSLRVSLLSRTVLFCFSNYDREPATW